MGSELPFQVMEQKIKENLLHLREKWWHIQIKLYWRGERDRERERERRRGRKAGNSDEETRSTTDRARPSEE